MPRQKFYDAGRFECGTASAPAVLADRSRDVRSERWRYTADTVLSVSAVGLFGAHRPQGIQDGQYRNAHIGEDGFPHVGDTEGA